VQSLQLYNCIIAIEKWGKEIQHTPLLQAVLNSRNIFSIN
jgi:hypothetical protein